MKLEKVPTRIYKKRINEAFISVVKEKNADSYSWVGNIICKNLIKNTDKRVEFFIDIDSTKAYKDVYILLNQEEGAKLRLTSKSIVKISSPSFFPELKNRVYFNVKLVSINDNEYLKLTYREEKEIEKQRKKSNQTL